MEHPSGNSQEPAPLCGRVLVVDDENGPRQALRLLLNAEHEVLLAQDVASARRLLETTPVDVVITDVRMPKETGVDLLAWVKTRYPDTEVIILTGYGELSSAKEAVAFGAFAYLEKPFDNDQMLRLIRAAVVKRRHELERRQLEDLAVEANRFETLGNFVFGMLHDLGTPLSVIGSHVELALAAPGVQGTASVQGTAGVQGTPMDTGLEKRLRTIQGQADYCREIVRSAMSFIRDESCRLTHVNLHETLEICLTVAHPLLTKCGVSVTRDLAAEQPMCEADCVLVRQAILNLITNACQALEKQSGNRELQVRTRREGDLLCLYVEDNGPGVPPEIRGQVFDRFFTTKGAGGTGLGLTAVQNIMQRHGGQVELLDGSLGGALFALKFPTRPWEIGAAAASPGPEFNGGSTARHDSHSIPEGRITSLRPPRPFSGFVPEHPVQTAPRTDNSPPNP